MPIDDPWKYFVCVCEEGGCVHGVLGEQTQLCRSGWLWSEWRALIFKHRFLRERDCKWFMIYTVGSQRKGWSSVKIHWFLPAYAPDSVLLFLYGMPFISHSVSKGNVFFACFSWLFHYLLTGFQSYFLCCQLSEHFCPEQKKKTCFSACQVHQRNRKATLRYWFQPEKTHTVDGGQSSCGIGDVSDALTMQRNAPSHQSRIEILILLTFCLGSQGKKTKKQNIFGHDYANKGRINLQACSVL